MKPDNKPKKNIVTIKVIATLCSLCIAILFIKPISVYAADVAVVFGSDSYESEIGTEFPVGVYIDGSESIGYYRVEIEYDPSRIEYIGGGSSGGEGVVIFEGNGTDVRESTMLSFRVVSGGNTTLRVRNADVRTAGNGEAFDITETAEVPLVIQGEEVPTDSETARAETENNATTDDQDSESDRIEDNNESTSTTEIAQQQNGNKEGDSLSGGILPVVVISILAGILGIIIAIVAVRKRNKKIRLRKEYIKSRNKQQVSDAYKAKDDAKSDVVDAVGNVPDKETGKISLHKNLDKDSTVDVLSEDTYVKGMLSEDDKVIISVRNVSMRFSVSGAANSSFKDYAIQKIKGKQKKKMLNALKHVSFEIYKGEVVGIIGTNGSGKSTLLKIISGAMQPSSGDVAVDKSKVQLLTLGTGFDAELTARENIYLNGAIIGYTKEFIDKHYDEIVEFAELEDFMDEKVKNFSSGMVSRLGFSIATVAGASEILILDEVLSVGDQFFKNKSMKRIKEMIHGGATVLIVSHSLGVIKSHCDKVIWLDKGVMKMVGKPETVCAEYSRYHP